MNRQREVIYSQRREVLGGEDLPGTYQGIIHETVEDMVATFCPDKSASTDWNWDGLIEDFVRQFSFLPDFGELDRSGTKRDDLDSWLKQKAERQLQLKEEEFSSPVMDQLMRILLLQAVDSQWKDHLLSIDHLKEGIGLRGYGQKNPKEEYKREAYGLFMEMMGRVREEVLHKIFRIQLAREEDVEEMEAQQRKQQKSMNAIGAEGQVKAPATRDQEKVGRNDPCPCGSGKKYKKCCGQ
jgi:preprotein translocase subunit SecA